MKGIIKDLARRFGIEIRRYAPAQSHDRVVSLVPEGACRGSMLLSYIIAPFLLKEGESLPSSHTNYGESLEIAATFLGMGYAVDVIDYRNRTFIPAKKYSCFVAARTNFARIAQLLNGDCIKIAHLDTAHWLFNNYATYQRGLALRERRGVAVGGVRTVEFNLAIEHADCATVLGNGFTLGTYAYAGKPLYRMYVPAAALYPWSETKRHDECRNSFLWLGSGGLVHKGLDLVLEAFSEMPDHHLYVCGPVKDERYFEQAFFKELYCTPNIHTLGWVDIASAEFAAVLERCIGIVYPSCSEGQAGSVVNCMQAGLIPIVSYESGIDVGDFGVMLRECSVAAVKEAVQEISHHPAASLGERSRRTWEYARRHHTREQFSEHYRATIRRIMEQHGSSRTPRKETSTASAMPKRRSVVTVPTSGRMSYE